MSERTLTQTVPIDAIEVGCRFRKDMGDLSGLMRSLDALGMLQPVGLTPDNLLVFGARRVESAKRLGWTEVPFVRVSVSPRSLAALRVERDENQEREPWKPSELVEIGRAIEEVKRVEAAERMKSGAREEPCGPGSTGSAGKTRDKVGEVLGVSGKTYERAKAVVETAPELVPAMDSGELPVKTAAAVAKLPKAKREKVAKAADPKAEAKKQLPKKAKAAEPEPCPDSVAAEPEAPADPLAAFVGKVNRLCSALDKFKVEVKELATDPFGRHIHTESVTGQLESARKALWQSRPSEPCNCVRGGAAPSPECRACYGCGRCPASRVLKGGR